MDVILVGLGNYGSGLAEYLLRRKKAILGVDFDPVALDKCASWECRSCTETWPTLTCTRIAPEPGAMGGRHRPLAEMNLALIHNLRNDGFSGKVALTATNSLEADAFKAAGRASGPQPLQGRYGTAADALAYAMDFLPENVDWPISFLEVRIPLRRFRRRADRPGAASVRFGNRHSGRQPGGQAYYEPGPDFRFSRETGCCSWGPRSGLKDAESLLNQLETRETAETPTARNRGNQGGGRVGDRRALPGRCPVPPEIRATLVGIRRAGTDYRHRAGRTPAGRRLPDRHRQGRNDPGTEESGPPCSRMRPETSQARPRPEESGGPVKESAGERFSSIL